VVIGANTVANPAFSAPSKTLIFLVLSEAETKGGTVDHAYQNIAYARQKGVVLALPPGQCVSSCTLYTTLLPDDLLCRQGPLDVVFHQFMWVANINTDSQGRISAMTPEEPVSGFRKWRLWRTYPSAVRKAVLARSPSGLPTWGQELHISAETLNVPLCTTLHRDFLAIRQGEL